MQYAPGTQSSSTVQEVPQASPWQLYGEHEVTLETQLPVAQ
jgi:hypothetical protein